MDNNKFQDRAELGIMMGLYPQIPHGIVAVTIQRNKTISEVYTAHVAPAHMEKTEKWFLKRDTKNPNQMVYVSMKSHLRNVGKNEGPVRSALILKFCPFCAFSLASSFSLAQTVRAGHGVGNLVFLQLNRP